ncbi:MAG TPA: helix-turn-helix transcriptional regulator [Vicinamibacterales bacterium]|nr:helix-turn-helix transcriptional regulator [Vicinamibacterales bacterium]
MHGNHYARAESGMSAYRAHAARIQFVVDRKHVDPSLTIGRVARMIGITPQHVCRVLKRERGLTFAEVLRDARVLAAQRLLRDSSCSMKEIAFRVGFRHASQFTRAFASSCGVPPSEFRAREAAAAAVHHEQAM